MKGTSYVFIDRQLYNVPQLLAHVKPGSRVVLLAGDRDGIEQISHALQQAQNIREIHLVAHGSPDCLYLGNSRLSLETLPQYAALLGQWRGAIAQGANILLYGCRVAAEGLGLVNALHTLTGASIAAASKPVGNGNWRLDRQIGAIAASLAFSTQLQQSYTGIFGTGYALSNNTLIAFDTSNPSNPAPAIAITGLGIGETLVGIDVRPQNGLLYGLTSNGAGGIRLYVISPRTGVATSLTDAPVLLSDGSTNLPIAGTNFGFDFNPTVDRIRVVTDAGVNLRLNPNTGLIVDGNMAAPGTQPDGAVSGGTATVDATAYTNSFPNTTATTQYTLDAATNSLFIQNPPNAGTQTATLAITLNGTPLDFTAANGFDIPPNVAVGTSNTPATGQGLAMLTVGGVTRLYGIELSTGAATFLGRVGDGTAPVQGFANQSGGGGLPIVAVDTNNNLLRLNSATPGSPVSVAITGLTTGERVVGIDFRPATGQLFALTSNGTGVRLAILDPQTGAATFLTTDFQQFSDASGNPIAIQGNSFGLDFNPTVDRVRIVTDAGLNFRMNPNTRAIVDGNTAAAGVQPDGAISGGTTTVDATAYTNSFAGTPVTTQYTLDAAIDTLFIQNPPNNGVQTSPLAITLNGARLDFTSVNGFDIPASVRVATANAPATGEAIAALMVSGTTGLYSIDLGTGAATLLGNVGDGSTGLVGLTVASAQIPVNQTLQGGSGRDLLRGGDGDDTLVGRGGRDRLLGFGGNDMLIGSKGGDGLTGSAGADRFVYSGRTQRAAFSQSLLANLDRIRDFSPAEGDRIQLDFDNNLTTPNLPRRLFNAGVQIGRSLQAAAESTYLDKNQARRGNQRLLANQAVFFEWRNRTYLSVNDSQTGFSARRDLLINVTPIAFNPGDAQAGVFSVGNYFA
jgi:Ca2+-binding RTX toxin-like protein